MTNKNTDLAQDFVNAYNARDRSTLLKLFDSRVHINIVDLLHFDSPQAYCNYLDQDWATHADSHLQTTRILPHTEGVIIEGRWQASMTGNAIFPNGKIVPPTHRKTALGFMISLETKAEKIVKLHAYWNTLKGMLDFGLDLSYFSSAAN